MHDAPLDTRAPAGIDISVTVDTVCCTIQSWSITIDRQYIGGVDHQTLDDAIRAMLATAPGAVCTLDDGSQIRVPHPQAAMAADVMRMDSSHTNYLVHSVLLVPDSAEAWEFLDPFYNPVEHHGRRSSSSSPTCTHQGLIPGQGAGLSQY